MKGEVMEKLGGALWFAFLAYIIVTNIGIVLVTIIGALFLGAVWAFVFEDD